MRMQIKKVIWNKTALFAALLHFVISFFTDRMIFDYVWMDFGSGLQAMKSLETIAVKIIFLLLLILIWQGLFYFAERADRTFRNLALFYFGVMMVLLILTWPGIWRMDEFGLLSSAMKLYPHWWQNYMTSVWYIFSLMLFPMPSGVILTMIMIESLLYARFLTNWLLFYRVSRMEELCRNKKNFAGNDAQHRPKWFIVLLSFPFFLPPVLDSGLYPMRMSLYAFLELTLLSELYFFYKKQKWAEEGRLQGDRDPRSETGSLLLISLLAAIVTMWRTEAIYYVIAYPVLLLLIRGRKRFWKPALLYLTVFAVLFAPQKIGEKLTSGEQYRLTSIVLPLVPLVLEASERGETALLAEIDLVVDTAVVERASAEGKNGISMFWSEPDFQRTYTADDFARFQSAYHKLIKKYPMVFLRERWETFLESSDLLENTTELFVRNDVQNYRDFRKYPLSEPISDDLRTAVIKTIEIRHPERYTEKYPMTNIIYSAIPAIFILIITVVILTLRKKWIPCVIVLAALVKAPLVFLTAPSRLFMYYYSVYLIGYAVLFIAIAMCVCKTKHGRD